MRPRSREAPETPAGGRGLRNRTATDALREAVRDHPGVEVRRQAVEGPAHRVLLKASAGADLIVVGARRRQGHFGLQLGRVAHTLSHHAQCPVAVVPHPS
ncbi:universal stress protein [Streptomyces sp. NPDC007162]|uniref:universal stress protein n=1 Tax=Streptomyces sp. NPDC007162 TaxID=3156917 RepID=UPI0033F33CE6